MFLKYSLLTLFILFSALGYSQRPDPDVLHTNKGDVIIQPILHGTLVLKFKDIVVYVDPYGGAKAFEGIDKPNLILITDIHGDHLNEKTLEAIDTKDATIIAPQAVADKISDKYKTQISILNNNQSTKEFGIGIDALPMYNLPQATDAKHVKGRGNGYLLKIGNKKLYISGDTEDIDEMRSLKNIDIAFICMNLPYTMDIKQAASAVLEFQPKIVYPYHYRGKPDMSDTTAFKNIVVDGNSQIEVRLRNWYPSY